MAASNSVVTDIECISTRTADYCFGWCLCIGGLVSTGSRRCERRRPNDDGSLQEHPCDRYFLTAACECFKLLNIVSASGRFWFLCTIWRWPLADDSPPSSRGAAVILGLSTTAAADRSAVAVDIQWRGFVDEDALAAAPGCIKALSYDVLVSDSGSNATLVQGSAISGAPVDGWYSVSYSLEPPALVNSNGTLIVLVDATGVATGSSANVSLGANSTLTAASSNSSTSMCIVACVAARSAVDLVSSSVCSQPLLLGGATAASRAFATYCLVVA